MNASVDPADSLLWLRRYLRLRLHGCAHDVASERIWRQLDTGEVPTLCARPDEVLFPPENESTDFRNQLESRLRGRPARHTSTGVDALGEVVWTQRYLEARVLGCSDRQAADSIVKQITGEPALRCPGLQ